MSVTIGKKIKNFSAPATSDLTFKLNDYKGKNIVLYFYPRDNTPGCTDESNDFSAQYAKFKRANAVVFGISRDTLASHEKFKAKFDFPFELISDPEETICNMFGVMKDKNMYGKKVRGIERSTFLINAEGVLVQEWRKVKIPEHVDEVLQAVKDI